MSTRATYNHPRLKPLLPEERQQLLLDAGSMLAASAPTWRFSKLAEPRHL
jgi:hypothetical protein